ncbi:MAG: TraR/DksA family transcriptional regulator [Gammaproteobacteria bacterium]|nr:TraR/DksA family transcriptional regulator [Gammaproteobacteria bacterium]MDE0224484.1 TraR/DksA family transcriptional regulator [Gammaproteobacteria bacterium]MDE0453354.1 TraR/DksA family transcriptional regulator [Gammaproteobacteria bacterium]
MDLEKRRRELEARRVELRDRVARVATHTQHREEPLPPDFAEQAVELENQGVLVAIDSELNAELRSIEVALRRIDADEYLYCESCGEEIGEPRLNALPSVALCIECAQKRDRRM